MEDILNEFVAACRPLIVPNNLSRQKGLMVIVIGEEEYTKFCDGLSNVTQKLISRLEDGNDTERN